MAETIRLANDVNRLAGSINGTAGRIDITASDIDRTAETIIPVARAILNDVNLINGNLDGSRLTGTSINTRAIAGAIDRDTDVIRDLANRAHGRASCIDGNVASIPDPLDPGPAAEVAHCR